jgi:hypothetical protein
MGKILAQSSFSPTMSPATQLNITMKNAPGNLANLSDVLKRADINIAAISCTEGADYSTIHLIVNDPETAKIILQPHWKVTATNLLAFKVKNKPGAIAAIGRACAGAGVNIRNIYSTTLGADAMVYVLVDDMEKATTFFKTWKDGIVKFVP